MDGHRGDVFFFNDTATTEIYTLSLHDALPICGVLGLAGAVAHHAAVAAAVGQVHRVQGLGQGADLVDLHQQRIRRAPRSEEHTSELQSRQYLVCRLLLEKKTMLNYGGLCAEQS